MPNKVKRIGYLPRRRVLEIIDEISKSESISRSKVVGILVEEALDARGIANFGYSNISKSNSYKSDNYKDVQNENILNSAIFLAFSGLETKKGWSDKSSNTLSIFNSLSSQSTLFHSSSNEVAKLSALSYSLSFIQIRI